MPGSIGNFLKQNDQLGSVVTLNHKGSGGFGTILGGTLSLLLSLFVAAFLSIQGFAWATSPSFS